MTDMHASWREVASKAEALGLKLKLHLEQDTEATDSTGGQVPPAKAGSTRAAIDELGNKMKDAFESFGAAAKDPAVRSDLSEIGLALKNALTVTLTTVGADVGEAVKDATEAVKNAGGRGQAGKQQPDSPGDDQDN
jgi:hypothetical protein